MRNQVGPTESALIVPVPAAGAVEPLRARLDPSAPLGVPAHVTILYPFVPPDLGTAHLDELRGLFGAVAPFPFRLGTVEWFGTDVVWLAPEPDVPFRELTQLATSRWPEFPPYEGEHSDPTPHLTIGDGAPVEQLEEAAGMASAHLPIDAVAEEVWLMIGTSEPDSWSVQAVFQLGG